MSKRRKPVEKKTYLVNVDALLLQSMAAREGAGIDHIKQVLALSPVPMSTAYSSLNKLVKRKLAVKTGSKSKGDEKFVITSEGRKIAVLEAATLMQVSNTLDGKIKVAAAHLINTKEAQAREEKGNRLRKRDNASKAETNGATMRQRTKPARRPLREPRA